MAYAVRLDPIVPLNAAEIDACDRFEADRAFDREGYPEWARERWVAAYRATCRGFAASAGGSDALKAEVERREIERNTIYREALGLPDMTNIAENQLHIKLMRAKS
jgi:hypothetical protein